MKAKFIQISCEGKVDSHAPDITGAYDSLCGIDKDDPTIEHSPVDELADKITCVTCREIWEVCRKLKYSDFKERP